MAIDGEPITSSCFGNLMDLCQELLGDIPPENSFTSNQIKLFWLNNRFRELPPHTNHVIISKYACAHILILFGILLMPDTSVSLVHFMHLPLLKDLANVLTSDGVHQCWHVCIVH